MTELFRAYIQLALLQKTPQDLPGHTLALWISLAAAFVTSVAGLLIAYSPGDAMLRSILALMVPGLLVYALLGVKNLQPRFRQAYSALCGSASVIYLIALPLLPGFFTADVGTVSGKLLVIFILLLDLWTVVITAHILRHTFDIGLASGVSLSLVVLVVTIMTIEAIAPTPRTAINDNDLLSDIATESVPATSIAASWQDPDRRG